LKHGVTAAAIKYKTNRQYIYFWRKRYDGTLDSLRERSRRPHGHPYQHRQDEIDQILEMRRKNPNDGLVVLWVKLRQKGYERSISGLFRALQRLGVFKVKLPNPKYIAKPYQQMTFPGERVQIDVKHVPMACLIGEIKERDDKLYQYTAIDEFSRLRYLEGFDEYSSYNSAIFLHNTIAFFKDHGFTVRCVQTDNGREFTNRFVPTNKDKQTLFERFAAKRGVFHKLIAPYKPRHNGKVERSHRKDNEHFYAVKKFRSLKDFQAQLAKHNRAYNLFPMRPLGWRSPSEAVGLWLNKPISASRFINKSKNIC